MKLNPKQHPSDRKPYDLSKTKIRKKNENRHKM